MLKGSTFNPKKRPTPALFGNSFLRKRYGFSIIRQICRILTFGRAVAARILRNCGATFPFMQYSVDIEFTAMYINVLFCGHKNIFLWAQIQTSTPVKIGNFIQIRSLRREMGETAAQNRLLSTLLGRSPNLAVFASKFLDTRGTGQPEIAQIWAISGPFYHLDKSDVFSVFRGDGDAQVLLFIDTTRFLFENGEIV